MDYKSKKVRVRCPVCDKSQIIEIPADQVRDLSSKMINGLGNLVVQGKICEHVFISYIDKNWQERGQERIDFLVQSVSIDMNEIIDGLTDVQINSNELFSRCVENIGLDDLKRFLFSAFLSGEYAIILDSKSDKNFNLIKESILLFLYYFGRGYLEYLSFVKADDSNSYWQFDFVYNGKDLLNAGTRYDAEQEDLFSSVVDDVLKLTRKSISLCKDFFRQINEISNEVINHHLIYGKVKRSTIRKDLRFSTFPYFTDERIWKICEYKKNYLLGRYRKFGERNLNEKIIALANKLSLEQLGKQKKIEETKEILEDLAKSIF